MIKVNQEKFYFYFEKFFIYIFNLMEVGLFFFGFSIYLFLIGNPDWYLSLYLAPISLLFTVITSFDDQSIYQKINKKFKIFGWKND